MSQRSMRLLAVLTVVGLVLLWLLSMMIYVVD